MVKKVGYIQHEFSEEVIGLMGSGSTGIAAKLLERAFIGIEREEDYIKIAEQRIIKTFCQQKLFD